MDFRQLVRWAIPGWLFIIFLAMFWLLHCALEGGLTWATIAIPLGENGLSPLELALALLTVGVPLGYVIDQLYWFSYWNRWPWLPIVRKDKPKWFGRVTRVELCPTIPHDRGYRILKDADIDFKSLFGMQLDPVSENRKIVPKEGFPVIGFGIMLDRPKDLMEKYKENWFLAEFAWYHTLSRQGLEFLEQEAQFLGNVYHSLGAARTSLTSACTVFVSHLVLSDISKHLLRIPLNFALLLFGCFLLSHAREDALDTLIALKHHVITSLAKLPRTCAHDRVDIVDGIHIMKN